MENERLAAQARRHARSGQFRKATAELEKLVAADAADMRTRLELADLHLRSNERDKAVEVYDEVARRYERDGFSLKALGVYLQIVRVAPDHQGAHVALARLYTEHGLLSTAAEHYDRALASVPDTAGLKGRLAVVATMLELDPDNVIDRVQLAEAYSGLGLLAEAASGLRRVAEVLDQRAADTDYNLVAERLLYHRDDPDVAKKLATAYVADEEPQRALAKLAGAYEASPRDLEILDLLAETFNQLGQVHKSVAVLKEMARLYNVSGLIHERDECHERVLQLDPNDRSSRAALGDTSTEAEGQTLEFAPSVEGELPTTGRPVRRVSGASPRPGLLPSAAPPALPSAPAPSDADGDMDVDFDFDFDDEDEIGFAGTVENTIVDDAFIPDTVRAQTGPEGGLSLRIPGAPNASASPGGGALQEDLRELDFYINNGLVEEAAALVRTLTERHGEHPLLERRAQELARMR